MPIADTATQLEVRPGRLSWISFGLSVLALAMLIAMHVIGFTVSWMLGGIVLMALGNSSASVLRLRPRAKEAILILGDIVAFAGIVATVMGR